MVSGSRQRFGWDVGDVYGGGYVVKLHVMEELLIVGVVIPDRNVLGLLPCNASLYEEDSPWVVAGNWDGAEYR